MTHFTKITKSLIEEVLGPSQSVKGKGRRYPCPACNNTRLWVTGQDKFGCSSCDDWDAIRIEILKRAGLWNEKKSDRSQPYQQQYDAPPRCLSEELKQELAASWRPKIENAENFQKEDPTTYPREVVWGLNFSSLMGENYVKSFLANPYYQGVMGGWVSTMGDGSPAKNQFKPTIAYKASDRDKADKCSFWLFTYLATGYVARGWQQYLYKKPAKYLTSMAGYGALIPKIPYQGPAYWENVKADKSIPLEGLEGAKKTAANLFCLGIASIGFVGVSMWREKGSDRFLPEIEDLIQDRQDYTIKFDADFARKPGVLREIINQGLAAQQLGATVYVAVWDERYGKGIDDVIAAGHDATYSGSIVKKLSFWEFLQKHPLPQVEDMRKTFRSFSQKLFVNFRKSCAAESRKFLEACFSKSSSTSEDEQVIQYVPDNTDFTAGVIEYDAKDRHKIWAEAGRLHKFVLDLSYTGSGKSHDCGKARPHQFDVEQIIYLHGQHANPATLTLGAWDNLPPRHSGLVSNPSRKNPDGSPKLSWPQKGQEPNICGNCKWASKFSQAQTANIPQDQLKAICDNCEHGYKKDKDGKFESFVCGNDEGEGYGYKLQRLRAMSSPLLRAHPAALPPDHTYEDAFLFWDEFSTEFINSKTVKVAIAKALSDFAILELKSPEIFEKLTPLRRALLEISQMSLPRYGFSDKDLRDIVNAQIDKLNPTLFQDDYWREEILTEAAKVFAINLESDIKRAGIESLEFETNWFLEFLQCVASESYGTMIFDKHGLNLTIRDSRIIEIAKQAKFNIMADATADPDIVSSMLGVPRHELLVIREKTPNHSHLEIVQVDFERKILKGDRSEELQNRIDAAYSVLVKRFGAGILPFNFKVNGQEGDLRTFAENRGVNRAQSLKAICAIGDPFINRGAIAIKYQSIYGRSVNLDGSDTEYETFYQHHCYSEVIQQVGRLRAARRQSGGPLFFYYFGQLDIRFLQKTLPGAKYKKILAREISPEAATKDIRFKVDLIEAAIASIKEGVVVTQEVLAKKLEVSQGTISKLVKRIAGGWWFLKGLFQTLLDNFSREWNNPKKMLESLSEEERIWLDGYLAPSIEAAFADECFPDEEMLALAFNDLLEQFKPGRVFALARSLSIESQFKLIKYLAQITGLDIKDLSPHLQFI